jgi:hypothetical protein
VVLVALVVGALVVRDGDGDGDDRAAEVRVKDASKERPTTTTSTAPDGSPAAADPTTQDGARADPPVTDGQGATAPAGATPGVTTGRSGVGSSNGPSGPTGVQPQLPSASESSPTPSPEPAGNTPPAPPPTAAPQSIICPSGGAVATFSPGLGSSKSSQSISLIDSRSGFGGCSDLSSRGITAGTLQGFVLTAGSIDCVLVAGNALGTGNIVWSNGSTSAATLRLELSSSGFAAPRGTATFTINSGPFTGAIGSSTVQVDFADRNLGCSPPVTRATLSLGALQLKV